MQKAMGAAFLATLLALALVSPAESFDVVMQATHASTFQRASVSSVQPRMSLLIPKLAAGGGGGRGSIRLRGGGDGGDGDGGKEEENPIMALWSSYLKALEDRPLFTRIATGFFIGLLGDIICQFVTGDLGKADIKRMLVFSMWGGFGFTPIAFKWYNIIDATIPVDWAGRGVWKMGMDQLLFPPVITAFTFLTLTVVEGLLCGFSLTLDAGFKFTGQKPAGLAALFDQGVAKVKETLWPTLITNYKVWPIAQAINFAFVPLKLQVLVVNCVAVWWNFVLSITQHK